MSGLWRCGGGIRGGGNSTHAVRKLGTGHPARADGSETSGGYTHVVTNFATFGTSLAVFGTVPITESQHEGLSVLWRGDPDDGEKM